MLIDIGSQVCRGFASRYVTMSNCLSC